MSKAVVPTALADEPISDSYNELSLRACFPGSDAARYCQHIYDVMGSRWNHPGNYGSGFDSCNSKPVTYPVSGNSRPF